MYSDLLMHLADSMAAAIAIAISDLLIVTPGYDSCIFAISELWIVISGPGDCGIRNSWPLGEPKKKREMDVMQNGCYVTWEKQLKFM